MAEIAAAAARIANGSRRWCKRRSRSRSRRSRPRPRRASRARVRDDRATDVRPRRAKTVRLSMAVGRRDGIRPADVVGSIANEADIPGRDIGPIDIQDDVTYVGIPERYVEVVIEKVGKNASAAAP